MKRAFATRRAAAAAVTLLAVAACGGSSHATVSSSASTDRPSTSSSSRSTSDGSSSGAADTDAIAETLLTQDVTDDASFGVAFQTHDLTAGETALSKARAALSTANSDLRDQTAGQAASKVNAYLGDSNAVIAAIDRVHDAATIDDFHQGLVTGLKPTLTHFKSDESDMRLALGLPKTDPWFEGQDAGDPVYSDDFSTTDNHWLTNPLSAGYFNDKFVITTPANGGNGHSSPSTPFSYAADQASVEVDAVPGDGSLFYGIECSPAVGDSTTHLVGTIASDGNWIIGEFHDNGPGLQLASSDQPDPSVHVGTRNHIRVDCDQFSDGLATVRLYVNGTLLGEASDTITIDPAREPGLLVVAQDASGAGQSVSFDNWSVAHLPD